MPGVTASDGTYLHIRSEGNGPPVVLLAGWGFSGAVWDAQAAALAAEHRVVRIDLRGHGASAAPAGGYGIDRVGADVREVLEALDLQGVTLVGWSFGGLAATLAAASCRARIARLMLVGSCGVATGARPGFPFGPPAGALRDALVASETAQGPAGRRATIAGGFAAAPSDELLDRLAADAAAMSSAAGVACLQTLFDTEQLELLGALQHLPILLVTGDRDRICPLDAARWICAQLDDARLLVVDDCGHYPMFEAPSTFDEALRQFARHPATTATTGG